MQYTDHYLSPLGNITLASDGSSLTGLWFNGQKHFGSFLRPEHEKKTLPLFEQTRQWLDDYFRGQVPASLPDLRPEGTPFRLAVWDLLREIPYGQTVTYKELAEELARRNKLASMSAQAVGNAVGHNPISILLPCHRVVGSNGSLTGYAGGLSRKLQLLTLERADLTRLHLPPCCRVTPPSGTRYRRGRTGALLPPEKPTVQKTIRQCLPTFRKFTKFVAN